jgi:hypothetical protein
MTNLAAPSNKAVLSPEQQNVLAKARQVASRPNVQRVPELRLYNTMMKVDGVQIGEYFIQEWDTEAKEQKITPIGPNPKIAILHRCYSYSYFDEDAKDASHPKGRLIAWTTEFNGFTALDTVTLFSSDGKDTKVEQQGSYKEIKAYINQKYVVQKPNGSIKKLMKFTNVLYVMYEGKVYRMFVSNASAAGVDGDEGADFKNPQPESLLDYLGKASEVREAAYFENQCELGSRFVEGERQYYLMLFKLVGPNPDLVAAIDTYGKLLADLDMLQKMDIQRMGGQVEGEPFASVPVPPSVDYNANRVKAEDLPF